MPLRLASQEELPAPLAGYRLLERLGRGGFGEVWKVEAPGGLLKAAKFVFGDLHSSDEQSRPAEQELKALRRVREIRHPYVLSLERFDIIDGQLVIVMELADRNLWDRFRECRARGLSGIPRPELLRYMEEAAEAIDLMNGHYQIQHLDIKPQNLFLVANHVKVGDFGLAKVLDGLTATVTGGVTPVYAAPETFEGRVTRFCDQYSLAIVYQELLTGSRPFAGTNARQLLLQHLTGTPDLEALPGGDRAVIARALSKKPEERWPSCLEMVQALRRADHPGMTAVSGVGVPAAVAASEAADLSQRMTPPPTQTGGGGPSSSLATRMAAGRGIPPLTVHGQPVSTPAPATVPRGGSVTPRLVTPTTTVRPPSRLLTSAELAAAPPSPVVALPPEQHGPGVLVPTLIVGLGDHGRRILERLQELVRQRFGGLDRVPHLRWLCIDPSGPRPGEPPAYEVVATPLHRPAHYLQQPRLADLEQRLPPGVLYRLNRQHDSPQGVRALGWLALWDHAAAVRKQFRRHLHALLADDPLRQAAAATGLELRSNRPRAYLLADLGGGTGSGMLLEAAYLLQREFERSGGLPPAVHAVVLLPQGGRPTSNDAAGRLANAAAALLELWHYQSGQGIYHAPPLAEGESPWTASYPPLQELCLIGYNDEEEMHARPMALAAAARLLFLQLFSPLGRHREPPPVPDRPAVPPQSVLPAPSTLPAVGRSVGLYRFHWPRQELHEELAYRLAVRWVEQWNRPPPETMPPGLAEWAEQQWQHHGLTIEQLLTGAEQALAQRLGESCEQRFQSLLQPLLTATPSAGKVDPYTVCQVLDELLRLVGTPDPKPPQGTGAWAALLEELAPQQQAEVESRLAAFAVAAVEVPGYRFAAARQVLKYSYDRWVGQLAELEQLRQQMAQQSRSHYARLLQVIGQLQAGGWTVSWRRTALGQELLELLRIFPRRRLQFLLLEYIITLGRHLLAGLPDLQRDLEQCQQNLRTVAEHLRQMAPATRSVEPGCWLFADGQMDIATAAQQLLDTLPAAVAAQWEQELQKQISRKFHGLSAVCLKVQRLGRIFAEWLVQQCRRLVEQHLDIPEPARILEQQIAEGAGLRLLAEAATAAEPLLRPTSPDAVARGVVIAPDAAIGHRLADCLQQLTEGLDWEAVAAEQELCLYREYGPLLLSELPHLQATGRRAVERMLAADHPPHTRVDVAWSWPATSQ